MSKPTRKELIRALTILLQWATGTNRDGNPYCKAEVRQALEVVARERGVDGRVNVDLNSEE